MTRALLALVLLLAACGGGSANREQLIVDVREAMERNVEAEADLERNNQIVVEAVEAGAFARMTRAEVEAAIGRGEQCGTRDVCARYEADATDWFYDVGRIGGGMHGGPTLILVFDTSGRVAHHYYVTRE